MVGALAILAVVGISLFVSSSFIGAQTIIMPEPDDYYSQHKGVPIMNAKYDATTRSMVIARQSADSCEGEAGSDRCCRLTCEALCGEYDLLCQKRCHPSCSSLITS